MILPRDAQAIKELAAGLGFDLAAFTDASPSRLDGDFLSAWCAEGKAAGMSWLARDPAARASPTALLPEALGVVTLGVSYFQGPVPSAPPKPAGRVARYAWGADYHAAIESRLERFRAGLLERFGAGVLARPTVDAQPLLERAFARRAGLGFVGKNTNLLAPLGGSYFFLADVLVNLALPADAPKAQGCGGCTACQSACPTGALDTPYQLDARLCVSYQTIENRPGPGRGVIPRDMRPKLGNWLFGCDDCQEVCPYNARAKAARWPEFSSDRGPGPWLDLAEVLSLRTDRSFRARFAGTSILRAKRAGLLRNAAIVAANQAAAGMGRLLAECLGEDPDPIVRGHAAWALGKLADRGALERHRSTEPEAWVREEIEAALA